MWTGSWRQSWIRLAPTRPSAAMKREGSLCWQPLRIMRPSQPWRRAHEFGLTRLGSGTRGFLAAYRSSGTPRHTRSGPISYVATSKSTVHEHLSVACRLRPKCEGSRIYQVWQTLTNSNSRGKLNLSQPRLAHPGTAQAYVRTVIQLPRRHRHHRHLNSAASWCACVATSNRATLA